MAFNRHCEPKGEAIQGRVGAGVAGSRDCVVGCAISQ